MLWKNEPEPGDRGGGPLKKHAHVIVPVLVAAGLRVTQLSIMAQRDPLFRIPVSDEWFHMSQARRIVETGILLPGVTAYYKGPLFSYVLAGLIAGLGEDGAIVAARALNVVLGCVVVFFVARIASGLGGPAAAWTAGLVAAVHGIAIYYDTSLLLVPLVTALLLAATQFLLAAQGAGGLPTYRLIAAGALLGVLTTARANGLLLIGAAGLWAALEARRSGWATGRAVALVVLPALLMLSPVTIRNTLAAKDPVLISWNGGINVFMGNDPGFDQTSGNWTTDMTWTRLYRAPFQLAPPEAPRRGSDHQSFFLRQAASSALSHPAASAKAIAHKALLVLSDYEIVNNRRIADARQRSPLLAVLTAEAPRFALPFGVLGPFLAIGLVAAWRTRPALLFFLLAAAIVVVPILFFNTARYRLPGLLLLVPLASAGWVAVARARIPKRTLVVAVVTAVVVMVIGSATMPQTPTRPPSDLLYLAEVAWRNGRFEAAAQWRREALARDPTDPLAEIRLGDSLRRLGRFQESVVHYQAIVARDDVHADMRNAAARSMALSLLALGRVQAAIGWLEKFLDADPDRPVTAGRPEFHLEGTPPLLACEARLVLADALQGNDQVARAAAELQRVRKDCPRGPFAKDAEIRLAALAYRLREHR